MKKIFMSLMAIAMVVAGAAALTGAFFSDEEKSTRNTFAAGAIDLQIDNTSYYNGKYNPDTSWTIRDLTVEKFFNFLDIKPGDHGEDTISIHVKDNPAYACINFRQTENSDNGFSEPEDMVDGVLDQADGTANGDLGKEINFMFWVDDGDNVLEVGETKFDGLTGQLENLFTKTAAIADKNTVPLDPQKTYYIAKFWCYGTPTVSYIYPQDGLGFTQAVDGNGPDVRPNFTCNGQLVTGGPKTFFGNLGQTDKFVGDISFYAIQARNNPDFVCSPSVFPTPLPVATPTPTPID